MTTKMSDEKLPPETKINAEELEQAIHALAAQLKAPIVSIRGFLGFIEREMNEGNIERAQADLKRVGGAADRMYLMINGLLEFARVGHMTNPPEDVPFEEIALAGLNNVETAIRERNIQVHVHPNLPTVRVDLTRLTEVIQNLVENAIKYIGDQPEPKIAIGVRSEKDETIFFVSDNGMGIDPEYHERVFNLFEKLDPQSQGTGIGLALVKRIIETHGGRVWVESEGAGKGSTFCFTLPAS
jgi:signal transduction histidine kinase